MKLGLKVKNNIKLKMSDNLIGIMCSTMVISLFIINIAAGLQEMTGVPQPMVSMACMILIFITLLPCIYLVFKRFNARVAIFWISTALVWGGRA